MLRYAASDNMLVDYSTKTCQGDFNLLIPEDQCAFLQLSDGRNGFLDAGEHTIRIDCSASANKHHETIRMYWFNLSDHIELHLSDTVTVMEQLLKTVNPELKLYAPVNVRVNTSLTIRIADRGKLLRILSARQAQNFKPVLDKQWLTRYLEKKLHYILEDAVNHAKQETGASLSHLLSMTDAIEVEMISDICEFLESMSLELVAAHVYQISPTSDGLAGFQEKEAETLTWYNQVQMDRFSHAGKSRRTKKSRPAAPDFLPESVCQVS